ncbi:hypothetical protein PsYK624_081690 [Phanerochaete sordida]|uniref:Uncharacterized protein n=1 Tax=Phanerochaete sordida TaxID=48140 RepID=A0A9P3GBV2_9APHY|nr:hypothetical protein PsYK624_081690 [Phanerochaete sordida]
MGDKSKARMSDDQNRECGHHTLNPERHSCKRLQYRASTATWSTPSSLSFNFFRPHPLPPSPKVAVCGRSSARAPAPPTSVRLLGSIHASMLLEALFYGSLLIRRDLSGKLGLFVGKEGVQSPAQHRLR